MGIMLPDLWMPSVCRAVPLWETLKIDLTTSGMFLKLPFSIYLGLFSQITGEQVARTIGSDYLCTELKRA